jgi:hypothetical protein
MFTSHESGPFDLGVDSSRIDKAPKAVPTANAALDVVLTERHDRSATTRTARKSQTWIFDLHGVLTLAIAVLFRSKSLRPHYLLGNGCANRRSTQGSGIIEGADSGDEGWRVSAHEFGAFPRFGAFLRNVR